VDKINAAIYAVSQFSIDFVRLSKFFIPQRHSTRKIENDGQDKGQSLYEGISDILDLGIIGGWVGGVGVIGLIVKRRITS